MGGAAGPTRTPRVRQGAQSGPASLAFPPPHRLMFLAEWTPTAKQFRHRRPERKRFFHYDFHSPETKLSVARFEVRHAQQQAKKLGPISRN